MIRSTIAALKKVRKHSRDRVEVFQREVDQILVQSMDKSRPSWGASFRYARCVLAGSLHRPAVHMAALAILTIVLGTKIFIPLGSTDFLTRLSLIAVAMLVGSTLSYFLLFLLLPFHLRYRISLWIIAAIHSLLSAVLFCATEPVIVQYFHGFAVPKFSSIFIPILLLYGLADMFVLWQFKEDICMRDYAQKHKLGHIKALLPADKRGEVWLISAADHYVEFFTDKGNHLQRMTMKAAVARAGTSQGLRVHRSHWVAFRVMLSLEKNGERFMLTLRTGQKIPVSRSMAKQVRHILAGEHARQNA